MNQLTTRDKQPQKHTYIPKFKGETSLQLANEFATIEISTAAVEVFTATLNSTNVITEAPTMLLQLSLQS